MGASCVPVRRFPPRGDQHFEIDCDNTTKRLVSYEDPENYHS